MTTRMDVYRGDTIDLDIAVFKDGAALDISGGSITVTLKDSLADADADALAQVAATITSAAGGLATATIPASATDGLTDDTLLYADAQYTNAAGKKKTVKFWEIYVTRDVTRA
jgi:hypothetical protein